VDSLWAVHDLSAALLTERFHAKWTGAAPVAAALHETARCLRQDIRNGDDLLKRVFLSFLCHIPANTPLYAACIAQAHDYASRAGTEAPFASPAYRAAFASVGKAW
jgi:CHAT domain-containing protein